MKCFKCSKKASVKVPSLEKPACDDCFKKIIEKRFNKTVKKIGINEIKIKLKRSSDKVLLHLLENRSKKVRGFKAETGKPNISQATLDDIAISIVKSFFTGKDLVIKERSPLESISEWELKEYARIEGLAFKSNPRKGQNKKVHEFIKELEQRRPGVMYSIKDFMKKLLQ